MLSFGGSEADAFAPGAPDLIKSYFMQAAVATQNVEVTATIIEDDNKVIFLHFSTTVVGSRNYARPSL